MSVVVIAEFTAKPGKAGELAAAFRAMIAPTRLEPGCLRYELNQEENDPGAFVFVEAYQDRAAFDAHCATPYFKALIEALPPLVDKQHVGLYREIPA
ncbi:MAG: putative quinol monooxygenase [Acidobacteriota bacterium]